MLYSKSVNVAQLKYDEHSATPGVPSRARFLNRSAAEKQSEPFLAVPFQRFCVWPIECFWRQADLSASRFQYRKQGVVRGFWVLMYDDFVLVRDSNYPPIKGPVRRPG